MSDNEKINRAKTLLEMAYDDLRSAKLLLSGDCYRSACSRSYYCIFHSIAALMIFYDIDSSNHVGLYRKFDELYVRNGNNADKLFSKQARQAQTLRETYEYHVFEIIEEDKYNIKNLLSAKYIYDCMVNVCKIRKFLKYSKIFQFLLKFNFKVSIINR
jgi:uncharacterized protein (UPF0332 family)